MRLNEKYEHISLDVEDPNHSNKTNANFFDRMNKKNATIVCSIAVGLVLIASGITAYSHHKNKAVAEAAAAMQAPHIFTPNEIENSVLNIGLSVNSLEKQLSNNPMLETQFAQLQSNLATLQNQISSQEANTANVVQTTSQGINQNIDSSTRQTMRSISAVNTAVNQLSKELQPIKYLDSSVLPFKVISVDFWNGVPKATVSIGGNYALLMQGQAKAGWTLVSITTGFKDILVFENSEKERVRVEL